MRETDEPERQRSEREKGARNRGARETEEPERQRNARERGVRE